MCTHARTHTHTDAEYAISNVTFSIQVMEDTQTTHTRAHTQTLVVTALYT